jgi:hypothetical protein
MKTKKWFIGCMMLMMVASGKLFAQEGKDMVRRATDSMQVRLTLNEEQYKQAYDINESFGKKMKGVKESGGRKLQQLQQLKAADKERDDAFKKILTDEQYAKYLADKKERREQMKENYRNSKN